jgi:spermidine/putrescine transport system ATP-binding protein
MVFEQNTGQRPQFRNGDEIDLAWSRDHAFLLDAEQDAHAGVITPEDME